MFQNLQTLSQQITHSEELFETPSPSRTGQSMTSGDLGDISSISTTPSIPDRRSCLSSRLSKGRSKSSSSSSLSRISPVETVLPSDGGEKRSDVLQRSSTSSFASVAFSDLMSSSTNMLLGRRSSILGAATTNTTTNKKSIDVPVQRVGHPVVVETTHNIPNVHPADMDTMIYTNQWDVIGRGTTAIGQPLTVYPRRSSSSFAPSDLLFPDDDEKRLSKDSRHSRSTSGGSTDTDHTMAGDGRQRSTSGSDDHLFSRPGQPLSRRSSSHVTGGGQSRHPQVESPVREKVVETVALDEAEVEKEVEKKERLDTFIHTIGNLFKNGITSNDCYNISYFLLMNIMIHLRKMHVVLFDAFDSSTETTRKSGMVRKPIYASFRQYPLSGAVFRVACTSARLIHCITDSGKP